MGSLSDLKSFYVYALINGRTHTIFYIGKVQGDRVFRHVKEVKQGIIETAKQNMIKNLEILYGGIQLTFSMNISHLQDIYRPTTLILKTTHQDNQIVL